MKPKNSIDIAAPHHDHRASGDYLYCKSSEQMDEVADASVSLVVTSPPYFNAIDYEVHTNDAAAWYRTRPKLDYDQYLDSLDRIWLECLRVLQPGRLIAVVAGTILENGRHRPLPFHLLQHLEDLGFEFHQDIIWNKVTGGVKRAGSVINHPYPGYYYPNIMTEYILLLRKPGGNKIYANRSKAEKQQAKLTIDPVFKRDVANTVWHIAPVPPGHLPHPCAFPEEIPYRLIHLYTYLGELVLDPFLGTGTTTKVSRWLGRRWAGYDTSQVYVNLARERLREPLRLRRKQLVSRIDKVPVEPFSPPKG